MIVVFQLVVSLCAGVAGYFLEGSAGLVFVSAGGLVAFGALVQWLMGSWSAAFGFFAFAVGGVTALVTLAGGQEAGPVGLLLGAVALVAAMGSLAKGKSRRGLVEVEGEKRGLRLLAAGAVLATVGLAVMLAFALPLWSSGVLALSKPLSNGARPLVSSTVNDIQNWLELKLPWFSKSPEEEVPEERTPEPFDGSHEVRGSGEVDLSDELKVAIRFESEEEFRAVVSDPVYVRTRTFDEFDGWRWEASEDEMEFFGDADDGRMDGWTRVAVAMPEAEEFEYEVFVVGSFGVELPALVDVTGFEFGSVVSKIPGWFSGGLTGDVHYRARSVSAGNLIPATGVDQERYLDDGGGQGLRELRVIAEGIEDPRANKREKLEQISAYLRRNCAYSLVVENPDGLPPMENFLSGTKKGYCDHFASAAVIMARVHGVPARLAMGFSGGVVDETQRMVAFAERDAHAWAEVLLDGRWTVFDTTPVSPGSQGGPRESPAFGDRQFVSASPIIEAAEDETAADDSQNSEAAVEEESFLARWGDWILRGVGALLLVLVLVRWILPWIGGNLEERRKERAGRVDSFDREPPMPVYLKEFFRFMELAGVFRPTGSTVRESVGAMKQAGWQAPVFDELADYHYAASYADRRRHPGLERKLRQEIRALGKRNSRKPR
ncbi:MAG: transglutaminase domain-containing protein [Verrucomicrobiota bacterium]